MDERHTPNPCGESWRTRVARLMTVALCATLCSAVVGAVGVKPSGNRRAAAAESLPAAKFEPVVMVPVVVVRETKPVTPVLPAPTITATSELLHPAAAANAAAPSALKPALPLPQLKSSPIRVIRMEVTAYCHCVKCCGPAAQGLTASGKPVSYNNGLFVAADTSVLPFGTRLVIPGYAGNRPVEVIDRGGAIRGNKLDVYYPSHGVAREWGRRFVDVIVLE